MTENEIDFDDTSLETSISVDETFDDPAKTGEQKEDEQKQENQEEPKKQRGRPAKQKEEVKTEVKDDFTDETKEETKESNEDENQVDEQFIVSMAKKLGIEIPEGVEFGDDEDGLAEFTDYVADVKADDKINGFLANVPDRIGQAFDLAQLIMDLSPEEQEAKIDEFFKGQSPELDYKSIDLTNEDTQKSIMRTFYKKMDYTDDDIKESIDDLEIAGTLSKQAKIAAAKLAAIQEKEKGSIIAREKQEADNRRANTQRFFGNVKQVIESGKVNNFTIPINERRSLFDYDVQGGFMQDLNEILKDPTKRTELALAVKNKFNLNKFVQAAASTQKVNSLRDKVKASQGKLKGGNSSGSVTNSNIDWDA